jgi:hypothetical protein
MAESRRNKMIKRLTQCVSMFMGVMVVGASVKQSVVYAATQPLQAAATKKGIPLPIKVV